jgi:hypothetical protein
MHMLKSALIYETQKHCNAHFSAYADPHSVSITGQRASTLKKQEDKKTILDNQSI